MKDGETIIEALKFAIRMELDGKQFYLESGKLSTNKLGKELFQWLAEQEDRHRERFESIFQTISAGKTWHDANTRPDRVSKPVTLFSEAAHEKKSFKADRDELKAVETAMQMEIKSRDYYKEQGEKSTLVDANKFFAALAAEEQGHYLYLVDYKEYITDPSDWFTHSEHHLLDGA